MSSDMSYAFYLDTENPGAFWAFPDPEGYADSVDFQTIASSPEEAERELALHRFADPEDFEADLSLVDEALAAFAQKWRVNWLPSFPSHKDYVAWSRRTWLKARRR